MKTLIKLTTICFLSLMILASSREEAFSQEEMETEPALPSGRSELDILSSGENPFLDFDQPEQRVPASVTIRALNKITAKYVDLTIPMNETASFGSLTILAHHCDTRPPEEFPETTAFLQIFDERSVLLDVKDDVEDRLSEQVSTKDETRATNAAKQERHAGERPVNIDGKRIFSGWMFASSPALNPLEHPVYDVWVIDCETQTATVE